MPYIHESNWAKMLDQSAKDDAALAERDAEIARLRGWLEHIGQIATDKVSKIARAALEHRHD